MATRMQVLRKPGKVTGRAAAVVDNLSCPGCQNFGAIVAIVWLRSRGPRDRRSSVEPPEHFRRANILVEVFALDQTV